MSKVPGIGDLFKQAQDLQERLQRVQEDAAARTVEATSGGGMVRATVNGRLELVRLQIEPGALAGGDVEMLQDLVIAAVNQALRSAQQQMADEMSKLTGGLKLPGLG
ncbi:MAG TPA: YbaB/EbfC family nucleoid-associated protein [Candidatus Dormibacteraeota bacterium]|nr:YbaB/EbfC family nucleoid-associated protein [Candidatus Dormibacteraeota bacterium]